MCRSCINCGTELNSKQFKYCSNKCQHEFEWATRKDVFEPTGNWPGTHHPYAKSRHYKQYLKDTRGHKCELCGITEWQGKEAPLVIDHINGDANDDSLSNLRLVCGNCDMQLDTYKGKNRGKGRHARRERYSAGKSY